MQILEIILLIVIIAILTLKQKPIRLNSKNSRKVILDSCALIDGRIVDLSNSGFVPDQLIVPEFIVQELQLLADGNDSHKRERARFGLDVVKELQNSKYSQVVINREFMKEKLPTDQKLVQLAKKMSASLYTTDYNLNKVADIEGVNVLNVNELAQVLRPAVLPGERLNVKIIQKGSSQSQGVGYLDDGTMVVVDNAIRSIGRIEEVEVVRSLQTVAGKMMFAQLVNNDRQHRSSKKV